MDDKKCETCRNHIETLGEGMCGHVDAEDCKENGLYLWAQTYESLRARNETLWDIIKNSYKLGVFDDMSNKMIESLRAEVAKLEEAILKAGPIDMGGALYKWMRCPFCGSFCENCENESPSCENCKNEKNLRHEDGCVYDTLRKSRKAKGGRDE